MVRIGGGAGVPKEAFIVKDDEGMVIVSGQYIREHSHLFSYTGSQKINSTVYHIYQFVPAIG
jgi:hypothetical protein